MPQPETRVSDAERNHVVERLNQAVGQGRITLAEFEERIGGVLAARTQQDLVPFTADLPAAAGSEVLTLRTRSSSLKRAGRWIVPRRVELDVRSASVRLDLTEAEFPALTVEVDISAKSSSITVVLPPGGSATLHELELTASTTSARVPEAGSPHLILRGTLKSSTLRVRYQRRFLWWRW